MQELIVQNLRSRTVRLALVMGLISGVESQVGFFSQFIPVAYRPLMIMLWPVAMIFMRNITNTALADK